MSTKAAPTTIADNAAETATRIAEVKTIPTSIYTRGKYGQISALQLPSPLRAQVEKLVSEASNANHVDEHGSWDFGIASDSKRGECESLNWDLYGIGHDCHSGSLLIVIQVRRFYRKKAGYWPTIQKNYFLVGRNEDGTTFAHSVSSAVIHAAIRLGRDVINSVQNWIFQGDYAAMLRQGDLALIPCSRRPSAPKIAKRTIILESSHRMTANVLRQNGQLFAKKPRLVHIPGTHPEIAGDDRWYQVVVGKRADFWKFATPTVD